MTNSLKLTGLVAGTTGLAALVLPFTGGISPIEGLLLAFELEGDSFFLFSISAPALLAIPIMVWQIRRIYAPVPANFEIILAYFFSIACMLPVLLASALTLTGGEQEIDLLRFSALTVYWCAVIGNLSLLVRNRVRGEPPVIRAEVFLLLGYVPNSLFALITFSYWGIIFGPSWNWDVGAYLVLATCIMFVAKVFLLLRRDIAPPH